MPEAPQNDYVRRILEQVILLRAANAFAPKENAPGGGIWTWRFRAAGWPVDVVLDQTVLEIRVYHGRDEVAMGRVPLRVMELLLGRDAGSGSPAAEGAAASSSPDECLAELRRIVADWKRGNARIFIQPPVQVGHPDHWNRA